MWPLSSSVDSEHHLPSLSALTAVALRPHLGSICNKKCGLFLEHSVSCALLHPLKTGRMFCLQLTDMLLVNINSPSEKKKKAFRKSLVNHSFRVSKS